MRPIMIGILEYPEAQQAAIHGLHDLFQTASRLSDEPGSQVLKSITINGLPHLRRSKTPLTALILPPSLSGTPTAETAAAIAPALEKLHARGTKLCSVCAGAFVLAQTGLLDGRAATTHWALAEQFSNRFPAVALDPSKMLIDHADVATAGGVMAWIDLALQLVEQHLGPAVMLETARMFLVDPGGREQSFYAKLSPKLAHGDRNIRKVQTWLQLNFRQAVTSRQMAVEAGMSERTFLRRFKAATGSNPIQYLQQLRVSDARSALETTTNPVAEIAWNVGYENESAFRKVFLREVGLSPAAYRTRFQKQL